MASVCATSGAVLPTSSPPSTLAPSAASPVLDLPPSIAMGRPQLELDDSLRDDDFCSSDEVKVFKDEGEEEKELTTNEELQAALSEDKSSLIQETELSIKQESARLHDLSKTDSSPGSPFSNGYQLMSPYPPSYIPDGGGSNSQPPPLTASMVRSTGSPSSFLYGDPLGSPPPAHMGGIPYSLDPSKGLRPLYPLHAASYPYSLLSPPEMPQFSPCSPLSRYGPGGLLTPPAGGYSPHSQPLLGPPPLDGSTSISGMTTGSSVTTVTASSRRSARERDRHDKRSTHIKKPLNAFMLYMKEMRPKIVAECTLKESAAINQILGRRWHSLSREEQAKYYEQARKERQLHMQMYPGWSARDNYAQSKKKKRKRESEGSSNNSQKKCRARYGLDQQDRWCKPCNRVSSDDRLLSGASMGMIPSSIGGGGYLDDAKLIGAGSCSLVDGGVAHITSSLMSLDSALLNDSHLLHPTNNNSNGNLPSSLVVPNNNIPSLNNGNDPQTSAALAAAAAAASVVVTTDSMVIDQHKVENGEHSPKYISL